MGNSTDLWFSTSGEPSTLPAYPHSLCLDSCFNHHPHHKETSSPSLTSIPFYQLSLSPSCLLFHREKESLLDRNSSNFLPAHLRYIHSLPEYPSSCPRKRGGPRALNPILSHFLEHLQFPQVCLHLAHPSLKTNNITNLLSNLQTLYLVTLSFLPFTAVTLK